MKTGSLRRRVTLTTLALLAIVLTAVVAAVTLAYRSKLDGDLRNRLTQVWGYEAYDPNVVEVHVSALRRKLEAHGPRILETVRGLGYRFDPR